jgi:nucleoside-diphosphate-sugar epimerase
VARGCAVSAAARRPCPEPGVRSLAMDLRDGASVAAAVRGHEAVVHAGALTGIAGRRADFLRTNVEGTGQVLAACRAHGVARLVHTSSPSVCFDGSDHRGADESLPLATRFLAAYPESKALAERLVLAANGAGFATCALRPHLVLGPGDENLMPRLVARARAGKLFVVGDGTNEVSFTWIENAAAAHADALLALEPGSAHAGRAYFVAQQEPVRLWAWLAALFERCGIPAPRRRVPRSLAYGAGALLELAWKALGRADEPPMTRFLAQQLAASHSYSSAAAQRDFGYRERVSTAEATERLVATLRGPP